MNKDELIQDLQGKIIYALNLPGMTAQDIAPDAKLFEDDGIGLDSVDALELVVMLEKEYGITIDDKNDTKSIFSCVNSMADYILAHGKK